MLPSSLYSPSDWAELFTLCTQVEDLDDPQSPHYIGPAVKVWEWLCEYSKTTASTMCNQTNNYGII